MMNVLHVIAPHFEGRLELDAPCPDLTDQLANRVDAGLLTAGNHSRANYVVTHQDGTGIHIVSNDLWTGINVGLNDVYVSLEGPAGVRYRVTFWTWARYAIGLCAAIAIPLGVAAVVALIVSADAKFDPKRDGLVLANLLFWGFAWPWVLIALHKRPARRSLERILREVAEA